MFVNKKIINKNFIGEILKQARYKTGLSLKMVSRHIGIDKKYLQALENDKWSELPGEVYAKNFLKKYCDFLEINFYDLNIDFEKINTFKNHDHQNDFRKKTQKKDFLNLPKVFQIFFLIIIITSILIYIFFQINSIIHEPKITIYHPVSDLIINDNNIEISGETENEVSIKINNELILLNSQNQFFQTLNLQQGLNIIKIEGKTKYSKTKIIERKIVVE